LKPVIAYFAYTKPLSASKGNKQHKPINRYKMENNRGMNQDEKVKSQYTKFVLMLLASSVAMYLTMYFNTYEIDHVYFSLTRFYITCLGISSMAVIMLLFMIRMYKDKKKNIAILLGSLFIFVSALTLVRTQTPIGDVLYLKAMIPHHSIAILTSKRADIKDPEVRKLADEIIKAQEMEIAEMKEYIKRLQSDK
jgi:heme/copper-type cytochrome/quinol oxidase subunit 4